MKTTYCVFNQTKETFLALKVACASTSTARLRGLFGKFALRPDEGLWLVPSQGIHTVGLLFPIDVVYLDADCRVIHVIEHLNPFRVAPIRLNAATVLELPLHTIFTSQTRVGDRLLVCLPEEMQAAMENANAKVTAAAK
jgi:uncharacterized membrane protein (UPF0127 family)